MVQYAKYANFGPKKIIVGNPQPMTLRCTE